MQAKMAKNRRKGVAGRNRRQGVSLLEVTIAASMLALVSVGAARALKTMFGGAKAAQAAAVRDRIFDRIERAALQPANLSRSSAGSADLKACLERANPSVADCTMPIVNGGWQPFSLLDASQPAGGLPLAGVAAAPIYYDTDGNPCFVNAPPLGKCLFEARSYFQPQCDGFPCDQAMTLAVRTEVSARAGSGLTMSTRTSAMRSPMSVREMRSLGTKTCDLGFRPEGVDEFGNPLCVPEVSRVCQNTLAAPPLNQPNQFPYYIDFGRKEVRCRQVVLEGGCGPGEYSTGHSPNGTAICQPIMAQVPPRVDIIVNSQLNLFACGQGVAVGTATNDGSPICEDQRAYFRDVIYPWKTVGFNTFATAVGGPGSGPWLTAAPAMVPGTQTMIFTIPGNPDPYTYTGTWFTVEQATCWVNGAAWFKAGNTYALMNCQPSGGPNLSVMNYWDPDPGGFQSIGSFSFFVVGVQNP